MCEMYRIVATWMVCAARLVMLLVELDLSNDELELCPSSFSAICVDNSRSEADLRRSRLVFHRRNDMRDVDDVATKREIK